MIEQQRQRIENAVTNMINEMDQTHLRKMQLINNYLVDRSGKQREMHLCAAKCCQDETSSLDGVQRCVERCSAPVNRAQSYVQHELGEFQGRLQRCVMQCNDDVKIKMPANPNESDIAKFTSQFERCAVSCVDKHVDLIPHLMKTIRSTLTRGGNAIPEV